MTDEEALKFLDTHNTSSVMPFEVKVYCSQALDKQIPKPLNDVSIFGGARCGECYTWIDDPDGINYCPHCGQRIDWEEDETC